MPKKPVQSENLNPVEAPVAPIESVETPKVTDPCWNCGEQLVDNKCANCGFDKSLVYNLDLEADKAARKQQATKQGE